MSSSHKAPDTFIKKNPLQEKNRTALDRKSKKSASVSLPPHNSDDNLHTYSGEMGLSCCITEAAENTQFLQLLPESGVTALHAPHKFSTAQFLW